MSDKVDTSFGLDLYLLHRSPSFLMRILHMRAGRFRSHSFAKLELLRKNFVTLATELLMSINSDAGIEKKLVESDPIKWPLRTRLKQQLAGVLG